MFQLELENQTLDGRYQITHRLAPGSFSEILGATDLQERQTVIIKALNPHLKGQPDAELKKKLVDNFQQEAEILAGLQHPHIVQLVGQGCGTDRGGRSFQYLVLENLVGGDLNKIYRKQPFTLSEALHYFRQVCDGLSFAHQRGIIHRDIKPDNLMLSADKRQIRIIDFGVAKKLSGDRNREVTRVGTDLYSPPEHNPELQGLQEPLTPAADVYSLAKTIYAAMSGTPPSEFRNRPITYLPSPLATMPWGAHLLKILRRATAERVGDRYATMTEFWQAFSALAESDYRPLVRPHAKPPFTTRPDTAPVRIPTPAPATATDSYEKVRIVVDLPEKIPPSSLPVDLSPALPAGPQQTSRWLALGMIGRGAAALTLLCLFAVLIIVVHSLLARHLPVEAAGATTIILAVLVVLIGYLGWQGYNQNRDGRRAGNLALTTFAFEVAKVNATGQITAQKKSSSRVFIEELEEDQELEMVLIPAGTFLMGSPIEEPERTASEGPQHQVTIPRFLLGRFPITQAQWQIVAQWPRVNREVDPMPSPFTGDELPVVNISYYDALEFCQRLAQITGRNYRLPGEAEWEYACRAESATPFHFGENINAELVNYDGQFPYANGPVGTTPDEPVAVGSTGTANAFGLSDMHGNVWEWCEDAWHDNYQGAPVDGRAWKSPRKTALRVVRGGSWFNPATLCRSAYRFSVPANQTREDQGFRVALTNDSSSRESANS